MTKPKYFSVFVSFFSSRAARTLGAWTLSMHKQYNSSTVKACKKKFTKDFMCTFIEHARVEICDQDTNTVEVFFWNSEERLWVKDNPTNTVHPSDIDA